MRSNVDVFQELVDLSIIERSFDANLASMRSYRSMLQNTLNNMRSS
jgi:flagellar basal body rod protein FlgC